jgi:hypothetical protein
VPEGKVAKNRVHLDLQTDDKLAAVEFLTSLGATVLQTNVGPTRWFVMADAEGNEFCIGDGGASLRRETTAVKGRTAHQWAQSTVAVNSSRRANGMHIVEGAVPLGHRT